MTQGLSISNNDPFTVRWFQNDYVGFQTYNQIMAGMAERKIVGEGATSNALSARWVSTMIAVEATCQSAFLFVQATFLTVFRPLTQALQLEFRSAFQTLKDHGKVALSALKVSLSMIPLILLGVISPSAAYEKLANALRTKIEDQKQEAVKAEKELEEVKSKAGKALGLSAAASASMTPASLSDSLKSKLREGHDTYISALEAIRSALNFSYFRAEDGNAVAQIVAGIEKLQSSPAALQALDQVLTDYGRQLKMVADNAVVAPAQRILVIEALAKVASDAHQQIPALTAELQSANGRLQQATTIITDLNAKIAANESAIAELQQRAVATPAEQDLFVDAVEGGEVATLRTELEDAKTTIADLKGRIQQISETHQRDIATAREEVQASLEQTQKSGQWLTTAQDTIKKLEDQLQELRTQHEKATKTNSAEKATLEAKIQALEADLETARADMMKVSYFGTLLATVISSRITHAESPLAADCQMFPHRTLRRSSLITNKIFLGGDLNEKYGTTVNWKDIFNVSKAYCDEFSNINTRIPELPELNYYFGNIFGDSLDDLLAKAEDGRIAPIPTGVPYLNQYFNRESKKYEPWAFGPNIINDTAFVMSDGTVPFFKFNKRDHGDSLAWPITTLPAHRAAALHAFGNLTPVIDTTILDDMEFKPISDDLKVKFDPNSDFNTDLSWLGHHGNMSKIATDQKDKAVRAHLEALATEYECEVVYMKLADIKVDQIGSLSSKLEYDTAVSKALVELAKKAAPSAEELD